MLIVIPKEKPTSWNKMYQGQHWIFRQQEAIRVHGLVSAYTHSITEKFTSPVAITITAYFDKYPIDPDNLNSKLYIDGLKSHVIIDDNYKYVDSVTTKTRIDKLNPRTEIAIEVLDK